MLGNTKRIERNWTKLLLPLIIAAGAALRLPSILAGPQRRVGLCLADDAFYYFQIARNIVNGVGPTFDGSVATNGFHPVYMALLLPLFAIWPEGGDAPVRAAMLLLAAAWLATAVPLYLIGRELCGRAAGLFAALMFCLSPYTAVISGMGVESPLAVLVMAWAAYWQLTRVRAQPDAPLKRVVVLGALLGLAMLCRTDSGLICVVLGLDLLWSMRSRPTRALRNALVCAATAGLVFAPWPLWSYIVLGHAGQDSGSALLVLTRHELANSGMEVGSYATLKLREALNMHLLRFLGFSTRAQALGLWGVLAVAAIVARIVRGPSGRAPGRGAFIFVGALAIWLFYAAIFWSQRFWYHGHTLFALSLLLGLLACRMRDLFSARRTSAALVLIAVLLAGWTPTALAIWKNGVQPWQSRYYQAAQDLGADRIEGVDPHEPLGAFNSGIYAYVSGREVVNLDGVVNREARDALAQGRLDQYLRQRRIDLIIDHAELIQSFGDRCQQGWSGLRVIKKYGDVFLVRLNQENRQ
ncbi:MAG: glycosyltransferase family 39 protein [Candidatus Alcyoniella australis]|nr:glycosyltransferase family 39 protein [Candidatus Alcyoniella australis]